MFPLTAGWCCSCIRECRFRGVYVISTHDCALESIDLRRRPLC